MVLSINGFEDIQYRFRGVSRYSSSKYITTTTTKTIIMIYIIYIINETYSITSLIVCRGLWCPSSTAWSGRLPSSCPTESSDGLCPGDGEQDGQVDSGCEDHGGCEEWLGMC